MTPLEFEQTEGFEFDPWDRHIFDEQAAAQYFLNTPTWKLKIGLYPVWPDTVEALKRVQ